MTETNIAENFKIVRQQINEAEKKCGRKEGSVKLCAVSKFHPVEEIEEALKCSQILFGENRVQEAYSKFSALKEKGFNNLQLHLIGALQSNKVKKACEISCAIESVDRESLLPEIEKHCSFFNKTMEVFFELHTGEDSKSGFKSEDEILICAEKIASGKFPHVNLTGLMTMAPFTEDEALIRKSFSSLRNLKEKLNVSFPQLPVKELSMGMSGDFKIAIEEGSTIVRIGTSLFGRRDYSGTENQGVNA